MINANSLANRVGCGERIGVAIIGELERWDIRPHSETLDRPPVNAATLNPCTTAGRTAGQES